MKLFLLDDIWNNKRGFAFRKPANYLAIGYHPGQDFFTVPPGQIPVIAPCDGILTTFPFSNSAGWWGYFTFSHRNETFSLKILHMFDALKGGKYKEGEVLGYCGATGLSITGGSQVNIGPSHEEQNSPKAVPHLHVELHIGEFKHDTNKIKHLADQRIIDPVSTFEKWVKEKSLVNNSMNFYKEPGKSTVYIKGTNGTYYPILMEKHFLNLFGDWSNNKVEEISDLGPKSESYLGLFRANQAGTYDPD